MARRCGHCGFARHLDDMQLEKIEGGARCEKGFRVQRVSKGPKNYLFGFHDLVQTNACGDLALALEVDDITHPPLPGEKCRAGVLHLDELEAGNNFEAIHETQTWNYPQGARQQWIGESDLFTCNDRAADDALICHISDARAGKVVRTLQYPVHCVNARTRQTFGINFDRVHACGGYGYTPGVKQKVAKRIVDIPEDDGIFVGDLDGGAARLLVSIAEVASCGEKRPIRTGYPHYLTHLMLNPSGTRLCFVDRYRVPDGGDIDRIMTIGVDGTDLRCIGKGFLSHFTWVDDETIFIWGRDEQRLCAFREAAWLRIPGVLQSALLAKRVMRFIRDRARGRSAALSSPFGDKAFLTITDSEKPIFEKHAVGILTEDGHPMASSANHHFIICDTYPNKEGDRWLMYYDLDKNVRTNIGQFRRIFVEPNPKEFDVEGCLKGIDVRVQKKFPRPLYLFTRSGLHTDLHPRWSFDGQTPYFDSIHEGTRQIYRVVEAGK